MGCVQQQAVLDFDEAVRAPWRPRLVPGGAAAPADAARSSAPPSTRQQPSRRNPSRVGACRPAGHPGRGLPAIGTARRGPVPGSGPATRVVRRARAHGRSGAAAVRLTRRARRLGVALVLGAGVALGSWLGPLVSGGGGALRLGGGGRGGGGAGRKLWCIRS